MKLKLFPRMFAGSGIDDSPDLDIPIVLPEEKTVKKHNGLSKTERDFKVITEKMKLPLAVAEWAYEIDPKRVKWICRALRDSFNESFGENLNISNPSSYLNTKEGYKGFEKSLIAYGELIKNDFYVVRDWIQSMGVVRVDGMPQCVEINRYSLKEAKKMAEQWHSLLQVMTSSNDEYGTVLMTLEGGYYFIDTGKSNDPDEAKAMGHCGNTWKGGSTITSLRRRFEVNGKMVFERLCTLAYSAASKTIYQAKGPKNSIPSKALWPMLVEFILSDHVQNRDSEYNPALDFNILQVDEESFEKVLNKKPGFIRGEVSVRLGRGTTELKDLNILPLIKKYPAFNKIVFEVLQEKKIGFKSYVALGMLDDAFEMIDKDTTTMLDLDELGLEEIPEHVYHLHELKILKLRKNKLKVLPARLGRMEKLISILAKDNEIEKVEDDFFMFSRVNILNLSQNKLTSIPDTVLVSERLIDLDLRDNPIEKEEAGRLKRRMWEAMEIDPKI